MENNKKINQKDLEDLRVSWIGLDGLLCLCFVFEAIFIGYSMIHDVDWVLGRLLPYSAMLVTAWVFFKYIGQVLYFSRKGHKQKD